MVNDNEDTPEREGAVALWATALALSIALHGVCMVLFKHSRVNTFTDEAIAATMHDDRTVQVNVRDDVPELDPDLFPELFPVAEREKPEEALQRLQDDAARLENDLAPFSPDADAALSSMPQLEAETPTMDATLEIDSVEPDFPEAETIAATPEKTDAKASLALPAVAPDDLLSRIGGDILSAPSPVTAGSISDVFLAAADGTDAQGNAASARKNGTGVSRPGGLLDIGDPFELSLKSLGKESERDGTDGGSNSAANGQDDAALADGSGANAAARAIIARSLADASAPDAPSVKAGANARLPQVSETFVARERAAVEELKDSQDGISFKENVDLDLTAWTDAEDPSTRYFRVKVASRPQKPLPRAGKDLVILMDTSGSIGTYRLNSCRKAIGEILANLAPKDRFNIVAFADEWNYAFASWADNTDENRRAAMKWLYERKVGGNTDIFATMSSTLTFPRNPSRPLIALVITDGDATSGVYRSNEILSGFTRLNDGLVSVYMYGVVEHANAYLMDIIGSGNRGGWIRHRQITKDQRERKDRESAAAELPAFAKKFAEPVLSDFTVIFNKAANAETYPRLVSNLYKGEDVEIYGKCPADRKELVFELRGLNGAQVYDSFFRKHFAAAQRGDPSLKREWAKRKLADMTLTYAANPSRELLAEMHALAEANNLEIPYEKEMSF
ncbi:MAG: VWA domain-containing protein [Kiritimatiellae bacterium]|nr:VWA domain-containing protein [Kiritimatiellia bacterium]